MSINIECIRLENNNERSVMSICVIVGLFENERKTSVMMMTLNKQSTSAAIFMFAFLTLSIGLSGADNLDIGRKRSCFLTARSSFSR